MAADISGEYFGSQQISLQWAYYISVGSGTVFLLLAAFTSIVPFISYLSDLACHGKRMINNGIIVRGRDGKEMKSREFYKLSSVPKSYFTQMYAVGLISGLFSSVAAFYIMCPQQSSCKTFYIAHSTILQGLFMFEMQCLRRLLECLYITKYGTSSMDVSAYLAGLLHYILVPICLLSSLFYHSSARPENHHVRTRIILRLSSLSIFLLGNVCQFLCHRILYNIKKTNSMKPAAVKHHRNDKYGGTMAQSNDCISRHHTSDKFKKLSEGNEVQHNAAAEQKLIDSTTRQLYSFPHGFGFDYVGCPHYTAEIAIYFSFFILQPTSIPLFCMLLWVVANLSVVADSQYEWYNENFAEEVSKIRGWKRLLPFVW